MTANDTLSLGLLLSLVTLACTMIGTLGNVDRRKHDDIEKEVKDRASIQQEFVKVNFKLDEFCRRLEELVKRYDITDAKLDEHEKRITALESKVFDEHERKTE